MYGRSLFLHVYIIFLSPIIHSRNAGARWKSVFSPDNACHARSNDTTASGDFFRAKRCRRRGRLDSRDTLAAPPHGPYAAPDVRITTITTVERPSVIIHENSILHETLKTRCLFSNLYAVVFTDSTTLVKIIIDKLNEIENYLLWPSQ